MGQHLQTGALKTLATGGCEPCCWTVTSDCCKTCLPRCFWVTIAGWGSGYIYAQLDGQAVLEWSGYIVADTGCPNELIFVEMSCDCDTDPPCGDDPDNCGWRLKLIGKYKLSTCDVGGPALVDDLDERFDTGWVCADLQACDYPSESFGSVEHEFPALINGVDTLVTVSLPPADKNCCASHCCCLDNEAIADGDALNLAWSNSFGTGDITLFFVAGQWGPSLAVEICSGIFVQFTLSCGRGGDYHGWQFDLVVGVFGTTLCPDEEIECDPFELHFTLPAGVPGFCAIVTEFVVTLL